MNKKLINKISYLVFFLFALPLAATQEARTIKPYFKVAGTFENNAEFTNGASLLNRSATGAQGDKIDRTLVSKAKLDLKIKAGDEENGINFQSTVRTRFVAGNPKLLSTTTDSIKLNESFVGKHSHKIEPYFMFLQEAWLGLSFDKLFKCNFSNMSFKIGSFPFSLGRGIALGDAFAVSPASLGFYSDRTVNRYAYGLLLSGDIATSRVQYDIYLAMLKNTSTGLGDTGSLSYEQYIINGAQPANYSRGFGSINMLYSGRLKLKAIEEENLKLNFEPYVLLNSDPHQKIDNPEDTKSDLITFGLASDIDYEKFSFGIETALNRGEQNVHAWDKNLVILQNRAGQLVEVYNNIYDNVPGAPGAQLALYNPASPIADPAGVLSSALNGQQIGTTGFYNSTKRFRDAYKTKYLGWMTIADASAWIYKKDLKLSVMAGVTSGDNNPSTKSGAIREYRGFVPLQEIYSGDKVRSVFGLGGSLVRPVGILSPGGFASTVDGFTDLIFTGMGMTYALKDVGCPFSINPNVLVFWKYNRINAFDQVNNVSFTDKSASNRLGVEFNSFFSVSLTSALKFTTNVAFFLPGKHYADIKGSPLDSDTAAALKEVEDSGAIVELLPTTGNDTAFTVSSGLSYSF